jgi:SAM-dependent methyltransferase
VATDIDPRFLDSLKGPNVEVRQHDILTDSLNGPYDFVHCRYVLEHLSEPARALRHMVGALRPGGVLLAESSDALCFGPADDSTPSARDLQMVATVLTEVLAASSVLDPFFGRKLLRLLTDVGLTSIRAEAYVEICRGTSSGARLLRLTIETVRGVLVRSGRLMEQELDAGLAVLDDPRANVMALGSVSAVGRA